MQLYYSPGSSSLAVHVALREAERDFELVRVDLRARRTASGEDYATINRKATVPALRMDGLVLTEIPAILQYIADLVPERRLAPPSGTFARYHLQEWLSFLSAELHQQFCPLFLPDTPAFVQERLRGKIGERFLYVADVLVDRAYLMGETFTVADCYLFAMLRWCERFDLDLPLWPNLADYYQRVVLRPTVQAALAAEGLLEAKRFRRTA
jgi:glutathione S-transferase